MATSGSSSFDLNIDDIINEAFERCGQRAMGGYDLKTARRSLNLLFSDWGNRGIHLWKVSLNEISLVAGTAQYAVDAAVSDVLEAYISTTAALPNKLATGQPSQYFVDRQTTPQILLYQAPDASTFTTLKFYSINRIQDATAYNGQQADVVYRFLPCMCAGLAYYLAMKKAPDRLQSMKLIYEDEIKRALEEDGQRTSLYISPQSYFPNVS